MFYIVFYSIYGLAALISASTPNQSKYLVMVTPQQLAVNGVFVDLDYKYKTNSYLVISPQVFYNEKGVKDGILVTDYNRLSGYGIGLANKHFFATDNPFYFSYGASFQHFNINKGIKLGNTYLAKDIGINRITGCYQLGYQASLNHFYFDLYAGMALRQSVVSSSVTFDNTGVDYGYSGVLFISGFRIGVGF